MLLDLPDTGPGQNTQIARPELEITLAEAFRRPLVVLSAGAGFGKTTALFHYLSGAEHRAVWFTFAQPDNAPTRFWNHLCRVFAQHRPGLGEKMRRLGFPETPQAFEAFLADLTAELYHDEQSVAFVFDDVHLLTEASVQNFLAGLISARLENCTVALCCQAWPAFPQPLPLRPALINTDMLRFSPSEAGALFAAAGVEADQREIGRINQYVAGWPIALSLAALALARGQASPTADMLSPTKPALYALFEREIFSQYSPEDQNLLLRLAVLDSFPRGLVQAVAGPQQKNLDHLLGAGSFIHYDADTSRFSFLSLYREFLRERQHGLSADSLRQTYLVAANWCRDNGFYYDAMSYYAHCGCHRELWQAFLETRAARHTKSEAEFAIRQIEALPEEFRARHPMTGIVLAALLVNIHRLGQAKKTLDAAKALLKGREQNEETDRLWGEYHIVCGLLLLARRENGFEAEFRQAAHYLPMGSRRWRNELRLIELGPGLNLESPKAGELKKSLTCYMEAAPHMAKVLHGAGQGLDKLCQCEALYLTGKVKNAAEPAYQALYEAQAAGQYDIAGSALFMLMRIYTAQGDYARLMDIRDRVRQSEQDERAQGLGIWDIIRGWFYAETGEVNKVALWIRSPVRQSLVQVGYERALQVRLRCLIATGQYTETLAMLGQLEALAGGRLSVVGQIYAELYRAVTHSAIGQPGKAAEALRAAYGKARGNRLYMPFIEYGARTRSLLERLGQTVGKAPPPEWLNEMHAKASTFAKRQAYLSGRYRQEDEGHLTDFGLSPRETELLASLSQGLTREEIADAMQLSINTVKSLTKQVFAKLGAINAAHAVRIAVVNRLI